MLTEVLATREPGGTSFVLSRNMWRSFVCSPIAVILSGLFAAGVYVLFDLSTGFLSIVALVAFLAVMAGFLIRDASEASNTRALRDLLCSITNFEEAERLLYGRPETNATRHESDEPIAAIPVEE